VLFIGTSDLSFSLGLRGDQDHPLVHEAIGKIVDAGKRHGKYLGRPAVSPASVPQFLEQGFQLFQAPTEIGLLSAGAEAYLRPLR
jgi:2-keto-3-deoxy-L-rhamnonate aldolase RhmA